MGTKDGPSNPVLSSANDVVGPDGVNLQVAVRAIFSWHEVHSGKAPQNAHPPHWASECDILHMDYLFVEIQDQAE